MKTKSRKILGASMLSVLTAMFIIGILFNAQVTEPIVENQITMDRVREWGVRPLADADPGAGNTGFMYGYFYPHTDNMQDAYNVNLSNATAYEYSDSINSSMTGETPYETTFDIILKFRVNSTDGYNSSAGAWQDGWVRAYLNETLLSISAEQMTEVVIGTEATTYRWYHYCLNNSGAGYTISKGEKLNMSINFEVYG